MNQRPHMPIREFSRLTGIKRENLRFYDQIGLLSPELRGENSYRYYAWKQIESAFLISDLRAMGVGIQEIKQYAAERSPEKMLALFETQEVRIQKEIERLQTIQELMRMRAETTKLAMAHEENALFLEEKKREPIFISPFWVNEETEEEDVLASYEYAASQGVNLSSPFGIIVDSQTLEEGKPSSTYRYYFKTRQKQNAYKPAATYAVAYGRYTFGKTDGIYSRLLSFIQKEGLRVAGDAYEEYPLDELAVREGEPYGVRVEIPVV